MGTFRLSPYSPPPVFSPDWFPFYPARSVMEKTQPTFPANVPSAPVFPSPVFPKLPPGFPISMYDLDGRQNMGLGNQPKYGTLDHRKLKVGRSTVPEGEKVRPSYLGKIVNLGHRDQSEDSIKMSVGDERARSSRDQRSQ